MSAAGDAATNDTSSRPITSGSSHSAHDATSSSALQHVNNAAAAEHDYEDADESEEEEEPRLKYDKLTSRLASLYRNGDSSSAFAVAGNKMVVGTHNGSVHILALPAVQALRTYQAHSATVTSCSVSPTPPPPTLVQRADGGGTTSLAFSSFTGTTPKAAPTNSKTGKATAQPPAIANSPDNAIFVATSSLDGHVCVFSLLDPKDVQLRNFARPVNAVALSPEYRSDRTYLSGGRAGQLILTKGGKAGVNSEANTNSAAAAASGWLGSIGLGSNTGKDTILHQGEGNISTIKWSLSGKWVAWVNEEGVKITRSHLRLGSEESENAWRRIAHAAKPNRRIWEEMAGVWRAQAQWVDSHALETDQLANTSVTANGTTEDNASKTRKKKFFEQLVVGWGDTAWLLHVHEGSTATAGTVSGKAQVGSADIIHKLQFRDCVVSGLALYSPTLLAILAYRIKDSKKKATPEDESSKGPKRGRAHKHTGLAPQLRLISISNGEELDVDELPMSRFETLSAQDYHVESLWIPPIIAEKTTRDKSTLEGLWEVSGGYYAQKMISSSASVLSRGSSGPDDDARKGGSITHVNSTYDVTPTKVRDRAGNEHQFLLEPGLKLFISSPYDCVIAVRRQRSDHLDWLLKHERFAQAWALVDEHPDVVDASTADQTSVQSGATAEAQQSLAGFLSPSDSASMRSQRQDNAAASREKLRIGELWLQQLTASQHWSEAGETASKVLQGSARWEHWVMLFAQAKHFDEIVPHIPSQTVYPSVPSIIYETVLDHYIKHKPEKARELVDTWEEGLFDASSIVSVIRTRLASHEIKENSEAWRSLLEALGQLYLELANPQEALKCFIRTQDAERAFALLQEEKIADALSDNVVGFVTIKVSPDQISTAALMQLDEASDQAIRILVAEAHKNTVLPRTVIDQLRQKGANFRPFLYFYLRGLWQSHEQVTGRGIFNKALHEGHAMVEDFADLAVETFAEYDRALLAEFLDASEVYDYGRAVEICEARGYTSELVLVLNRTGQTKRALWLIIDQLGDVGKAITFVKQNPDLWEDLLEYGMTKTKFIRGLLAEVGTSIDPVKVVRRIPAGLEIEGLKEGILRLVQGWEVQLEVSKGVERVLRGEVVENMEKLRRDQRQAIRFDVVHETMTDVEVTVAAPSIQSGHDEEAHNGPAGHCKACGEVFHEDEKQPILGFACGHVYHLGCLLNANPETSAPDVFERVMGSLGYEQNVDLEKSAYHGRSVGAKVTHAHIIRNTVKDGCQHCRSIR